MSAERYIENPFKSGDFPKCLETAPDVDLVLFVLSQDEDGPSDAIDDAIAFCAKNNLCRQACVLLDVVCREGPPVNINFRIQPEHKSMLLKYARYYNEERNKLAFMETGDYIFYKAIREKVSFGGNEWQDFIDRLPHVSAESGKLFLAGYARENPIRYEEDFYKAANMFKQFKYGGSVQSLLSGCLGVNWRDFVSKNRDSISSCVASENPYVPAFNFFHGWRRRLFNEECRLMLDLSIAFASTDVPHLVVDVIFESLCCGFSPFLPNMKIRLDIFNSARLCY